MASMQMEEVASVQVYVARQPIFDSRMRIWAYEMLFRSGVENYFAWHDGDAATATVIDRSFFAFDLDSLTQGHKAFMNFTPRLLLEGMPSFMSPDKVGIEVLEGVEPTPDLITACEKLKNMGYTISLDDYVPGQSSDALIDLADIVKVDFTNTPVDARRAMVNDPQFEHVTLLAEKVETKEQFAQAASWGYSYFQGFFFSKPEIHSAQSIPPQKLSCLELLRLVSADEPNFRALADAIGHDQGLTYRLLRMVNSAAIGLRQEVTSISHALMLLGWVELRRWVSMLLLMDVGDEKPSVLMSSSVIRARFAELLSQATDMYKQSSELFLMGLFSLVDAVLDVPMEEALKSIPITDDVRHALTGKDSPFAPLLSLIQSYEQGRFEEAMEIGDSLGLDLDDIPRAYHSAVIWADLSVGS